MVAPEGTQQYECGFLQGNRMQDVQEARFWWTGTAGFHMAGGTLMPSNARPSERTFSASSVRPKLA